MAEKNRLKPHSGVTGPYSFWVDLKASWRFCLSSLGSNGRVGRRHAGAETPWHSSVKGKTAAGPHTTCCCACQSSGWTFALHGLLAVVLQVYIGNRETDLHNFIVRNRQILVCVYIRLSPKMYWAKLWCTFINNMISHYIVTIHLKSCKAYICVYTQKTTHFYTCVIAVWCIFEFSNSSHFYLFVLCIKHS